MKLSLFGKKQKAVLGLDLGAGGVKLVELEEAKGRSQLRTYAYSESLVETKENLIDNPAAAAETIKKMRERAKSKTGRVVAGLPIASVFSSIISVPQASGKELKEAIEWQAKKLIPLPLEEMVLDWKILTEKKTNQKKVGSDSSRGLIEPPTIRTIIPGLKETKREGPPELGKKSIRILLTAAAKELVRKYTEIGKMAGLELAALETEAFALVRSLIGKDPGRMMIIDCGLLRTSFVIVEGGLPVLTRTINLGGASITRAIAQTLSLALTEAEQMKRDIHRLVALGSEGRMPLLLTKILEPMVTEARYSMNLYRTQLGQAATDQFLEKIILTGGSSLLPYLTDYLGSQLNLRAFLGDPWARVLTHEELRPTLEEIGPRFAVAVGLAMREFE